MKTPEEIYVDFDKLPQEEKWRLWAMLQQWKVAQDEALYLICKTLNHEMGMPWTDPRTGKTYEPPGKKEIEK